MAEALRTQMLGGVQFTHGSSALMSDIMANFAAEGLTDAQAQIENQMKDLSTKDFDNLILGEWHGLGPTFEKAAEFRDQLRKLREKFYGADVSDLV